jgi:cold shock CspA family protein
MIGKCNFWNQPKGFGFITVTAAENGGLAQQQYFFHWSNFTKDQIPVVNAFMVFELGDAVAPGKKVQAVGVRFATAAEIAAHLEERNAGLDALAGAR